jgi:V/A-type H+/Na+-transporting ATPase subunit E
VLAASAAAERAYQQQVQAAELAQRAERDRLRWTLIGAVLDNLPTRLTALTADETRYLPLLLAYLRDAAQAIERDSLVVQVNARDMQRLQPGWDTHAQAAAAGKRLTLSPTAIDTLGGVVVTSAEGDIRVDHSFEGRMERMRIALYGAVAAQLFPAVLSPTGTAAHG